MVRTLAPRILVVILVVVALLLVPASALVGNHENIPPGRGLSVLEERVAELEGQVATLQTQVDTMAARLPHPSGITLSVSRPVTGPGSEVGVSGTVTDQFGNGLPGAVVALSATSGTIDESMIADGAGNYEAVFTAPDSLDTTTVLTATANGTTTEATVETWGEPASITISLTPGEGDIGTPLCGQSSCGRIRVLVRDASDRPVGGVDVELHEFVGDRTFTGTTMDREFIGEYWVVPSTFDPIARPNVITVRVVGTDIVAQFEI